MLPFTSKNTRSSLLAALAAFFICIANAQAQTCPFDAPGTRLTQHGLMIARYALGFRGDALMPNTGLPSAYAATFEAGIACANCGFNLTGSTSSGVTVITATDAAIVLRKMAGLTGNALTDGLSLGSGSRNSASSVQSFIASGCGQPTPVCSAGNALCVIARSPTTAVAEWKAASNAVDYVLLRGSTQLIVAEDTQLRFRAIDLVPGSSNIFQLKALDANGATLASASVTLTQPSGSEDLTERDLPPFGSTLARGMTTFGWSPNPLYDTCSKPLHDAHWTYGPDNKVYPTWHPPVYEFANGSTCFFGHEHGQDPRRATLFSTLNFFPFAYVSEQLSPSDPAFQRNEDHYGHKIEFSNNLPSSSGPTCNVLSKFHMGTHGADAFANNTHEIFVNLECSNGLKVRWKSLHALGEPGVITEFVNGPNGVSERDFVSGRAPNPTNQPTWGTHRIMPTLASVEDSATLNRLLTAGESWVAAIGAYIKDGGGNNLLAFGATPYWRTKNSARIYDPTSPNSLKRWIELCYVPSALSYTTDFCVAARARSATPIAWDSPLSPFRGTNRAVDFNSTVSLVNVSNTAYWYSHPYAFDYSGQVPRFVTQRSALHPIRMYFAKTPTSAGLSIDHLYNFAGENQDCCGLSFFDFGSFKLKSDQTIDSGVHAPN
jgi:hypothetical protein